MSSKANGMSTLEIDVGDIRPVSVAFTADELVVTLADGRKIATPLAWYPLLRDGYIGKLIASYDWLERELDVDSQIHIGHIALATTLSWLEFRELPGFRKYRPRLAAWLDGFEGRPSMRATPLSGETRD